MTAPLPRPFGAVRLPAVLTVLDPPHRHGRACFWDLHQCCWRCPQPRTAPH